MNPHDTGEKFCKNLAPVAETFEPPPELKNHVGHAMDAIHLQKISYSELRNV
jgi:hypothetical protein